MEYRDNTHINKMDFCLGMTVKEKKILKGTMAWLIQQNPP